MYIVIFDYYDLPQYRFFSSYDEVSDFMSLASNDGSIQRIFIRQLEGDDLAILRGCKL